MDFQKTGDHLDTIFYPDEYNLKSSYGYRLTFGEEVCLKGQFNSLYTARFIILRTFYKENHMKYTLLAALLIALTLTACGKPTQALPETEKANYDKVMSGGEPDVKKK